MGGEHEMAQQARTAETSYTVIYDTLDRLPDDGPGIYNRPADPSCTHPLGMRWVVRESEFANSWSGKGLLPAPDAVVCLCCGCDTLDLRRTKGGKLVPATHAKTRGECEAMLHREFLAHWRNRDMRPSTVARTLYYLFGTCRAFPRPTSYYRGRACPDRALAKLRAQPRQTPTALGTARRMRAEGRIAEFPRSLARLSTAIIATVDGKVGRTFHMRKPAWMSAIRAKAR
jgi:hypothetical protein